MVCRTYLCVYICVLLKDITGITAQSKVTDVEETPKLTEAILQAGQELGEPTTDVNGKEQKGNAFQF